MCLGMSPQSLELWPFPALLNDVRSSPCGGSSTFGDVVDEVLRLLVASEDLEAALTPRVRELIARLTANGSPMGSPVANSTRGVADDAVERGCVEGQGDGGVVAPDHDCT